MTADRRRLGRLGEQEARLRLSRSGYRIMDENWRCRLGELDIVAEYEGRIIFVEVRARSSAAAGRFGTAAESVDERKRRQVRKVADAYLKQAKLPDVFVRFDVIAVEFESDNETVRSYTHYEAAF